MGIRIRNCFCNILAAGFLLSPFVGVPAFAVVAIPGEELIKIKVIISGVPSPNYELDLAVDPDSFNINGCNFIREDDSPPPYEAIATNEITGNKSVTLLSPYKNATISLQGMSDFTAEKGGHIKIIYPSWIGMIVKEKSHIFLLRRSEGRPVANPWMALDDPEFIEGVGTGTENISLKEVKTIHILGHFQYTGYKFNMIINDPNL